jgi:hypothetical protein
MSVIAMASLRPSRRTNGSGKKDLSQFCFATYATFPFGVNVPAEETPSRAIARERFELSSFTA